MIERLPSVLSTIDLPWAELLAARLDGDLYTVDECFAPVDEIEQPRHRAAALRSQCADRVIAEKRSAAWIWGALDRPPARHELCVAIGARVTAPAETWLTVREVVIAASELTTIGDMQLTTRLRTAVDILRFSPAFGPEEAQIVRCLMRDGGFGIQDCVADLTSRRNLPHKRRALDRLTRL